MSASKPVLDYRAPPPSTHDGLYRAATRIGQVLLAAVVLGTIAYVATASEQLVYVLLGGVGYLIGAPLCLISIVSGLTFAVLTRDLASRNDLHHERVVAAVLWPFAAPALLTLVIFFFAVADSDRYR